MTKETEQIVGKITKEDRKRINEIKAELGGKPDTKMVNLAIKIFIAEYEKKKLLKQ